MLFAAGMGIGLMFFGVAEPIMHYATPPVGSPESAAAARQAMRITFFHWGIHAWAIYAVVALSLAYFAYRHNLPLRVRSALYPLIGDRIHGPLGHAVDTFAALGTIFGLATSLGLGVMQINAGLNYLFGLEVSTLVQVGLITVITLVATGSVVAGLDSGVRRLSELNMILAAALLAFVLVCGPTVHLMQALVQNTGMYVSQLFSMTFNLYAYEPTGWLGGWTLFYWGWWIAWSPFVGMFIARISRGRTVREFVVGVLLVPLGFTFLWMTIYGNTALHMVRAEGIQQLVQAVSTDSSMALFEFLEHLPLTMLTSSLAVILVALFFVTSADSGALVIDMLTSKGEQESPVWQRIFWALLVGGLAIALLVAGGLGIIAGGHHCQCVAIYDRHDPDVLGTAEGHASGCNQALDPARGTYPAGYQRGLAGAPALLAHNPLKIEVTGFIEQRVIPALEEVAAELRKQDLPVQVSKGRMVVRGCRLAMARRWTSSTRYGPSPMSRRRSPCRIPVGRSARVPVITVRRSICGRAGRTTTSWDGPRFNSSTMCSINTSATVSSWTRCARRICTQMPPGERHLPWVGHDPALTWPRRPAVLLMVELPRK
jgi:choline/glycine/proline betaine transport protein